MTSPFHFVFVLKSSLKTNGILQSGFKQPIKEENVRLSIRQDLALACKGLLRGDQVSYWAHMKVVTALLCTLTINMAKAIEFDYG